MKILTILLITLSSCNFGSSGTDYFKTYEQNKREVSKLAFLSVPEFVNHFGYPCESHRVTSKDGYILTMHRVPHGRNNTSRRRPKPIVYLQHGLFAFSGDTFLSGPEKGLGFLLADAGFDVWVGNARGTRYSRAHIKLNPDTDKDFWDYSFHEIGIHDVPAMIDYALGYTKQKKVFYIGHSQGTTVYYALMSERPEYNEKIHIHFSFSPVVFMAGIRGPMVSFFDTFGKATELGAESVKFYEVTRDHPIIDLLFHYACIPYLEIMCVEDMFFIAGPNTKQMNVTLLPILLANYPAGASIKQLTHYLQEKKSENFAKFDYGLIKNIFVYKSPNPPNYNLSRITAPVYMLCSDNDYLSSMKDVNRLYNAVPNTTKKIIWKIGDPMWNHFDYLFGIQAKELIYDRVIDIMKAYLS